ncbi:MAG: hypothetical protein VX181_15355, partial [Pseudomonadota bacterium]|nr:hypothetical protein [Pseudomonadota bacterium]
QSMVHFSDSPCLWDDYRLPSSLHHQAAVGDVLLFRMRQGSVAKHLGLQSGVSAAPRFIHAYSGHGVVETALSQPWQRRIVARFGWPETPRQI